jgi:hypothetical protein
LLKEDFGFWVAPKEFGIERFRKGRLERKNALEAFIEGLNCQCHRILLLSRGLRLCHPLCVNDEIPGVKK